MSSNGEDAQEDPDKGERKRQREKQRRSDLANAFEELQMTLNRIEQGSDAYGRPVKMDLTAETPVTRLGLVLQTTETLQRLYQENIHMRLSLGGQWTEDAQRSWRSEPGNGIYHSHYSQPPYFHGHAYSDTYHSPATPPSYNGYHRQVVWDRSNHALHAHYNDLAAAAASPAGPPASPNGGYNGTPSHPSSHT